MKRQTLLYVTIFVIAAGLTAGVAALLVNINERKTGLLTKTKN